MPGSGRIRKPLEDLRQQESPTPDVLIPMQIGEMPVYLAIPPSEGRLADVVIVHDAGGMTQDTRNQALQEMTTAFPGYLDSGTSLQS